MPKQPNPVSVDAGETNPRTGAPVWGGGESRLHFLARVEAFEAGSAPVVAPVPMPDSDVGDAELG